MGPPAGDPREKNSVVKYLLSSYELFAVTEHVFTLILEHFVVRPVAWSVY